MAVWHFPMDVLKKIYAEKQRAIGKIMVLPVKGVDNVDFKQQQCYCSKTWAISIVDDEKISCQVRRIILDL